MTPPPLLPGIATPPHLAVKYSLTRPDILRWHFYVLTHNRVLIAFGLILSLGFVWHDLSTPDLAASSIVFKVFYAVVFTAIMLSIMASLTMLMMACMVMFKKYRGFLGDQELEIREDGLVERTDVNESVHRWAGFHKFVSTRRYFYVYVTDNSAHVVPRRCFASEQEQNAFRDEIKKRIRKG